MPVIRLWYAGKICAGRIAEKLMGRPSRIGWFRLIHPPPHVCPVAMVVVTCPRPQIIDAIVDGPAIAFEAIEEIDLLHPDMAVGQSHPR